MDPKHSGSHLRNTPNTPTMRIAASSHLGRTDIRLTLASLNETRLNESPSTSGVQPKQHALPPTKGKKGKEKIPAKLDDNATEFKSLLKSKIQEGGYSPKQVLNIMKTKLCWRLPVENYISGDILSTSNSDNWTLVLGGNTEGDLKLKPLVIHSSQIDGGESNNNVVCKYTKGKVTGRIIEEYITWTLASVIQDLCLENDLRNKALIVLDSLGPQKVKSDNIPGHIQVLSAPANTRTWLYPTNEGFARTFSHKYHCKVTKDIMGYTENSSKGAIKKRWSEYSTKKAIENISSCWNAITNEEMKNLWRHISTLIQYENYSSNLSMSSSLTRNREGHQEKRKSKVIELADEEDVQLSVKKPKKELYSSFPSSSSSSQSKYSPSNFLTGISFQDKMTTLPSYHSKKTAAEAMRGFTGTALPVGEMSQERLQEAEV